VVAAIAADDLFDLVVEGVQANFFLHCLYVKAGNALRALSLNHALGGEVRDHAVALELLDWIERGRNRQHPWIQTWADRAEAILAAPRSFRYNDWFENVLVSDPGGP
jgi:hypothetical protein